MASTTAMFTALSGMTANSRSLDVVGNNIANVNTTAYKSNRLLFSTQFSRTYSAGSAPSDTTGGTNPFQVGLGVSIAGTQRNFTGGTISATGDSRDLAIEGDGFFIVNRGGEQLYTRAGAFRTNATNDLISITGDRLQGWTVDANNNIIEGGLVNLNIPLGTMTLAEATENVRFSGNLNASGALASQGSAIRIMGTSTTGMRAIATASPPPGPGNVLEAVTRLIDIEDPAQPGSGTPMLSVGQSLSFTGIEKGGKTLRPAELAIDATTTVQDLNDFLTDLLGIDTASGANPDGATPGVALDPVTGILTATGNVGTVNDLEIEASDIQILDSAGAFVRSPLLTDKTANADGEAVRTTFIAYDSLGTPVSVDVAMVLDGRSSTGTTWRYFVESADDTDPSTFIASGTLEFDTVGQLATRDPIPITVDRANTGAQTPLTIDLSFAGDEDNVTSLTDDSSAIAATFADGSPIGTLTSYAVGTDGVIIGSFTNGLTRTIGQVVLAKFPNSEGLVDVGSNLFRVGSNSGTPLIAAAGTLGSGRLVGGALELSNVDLSQEFINMILASTGYSASSRVIRTTDELMQQLLVLGR
ncbi:MAG: flagellar hook-basal body complex protein [Phycisphaerales bacterium]|nr:flagellar hook-basal body complex protein [Phycisphaerales bacterium]